MWRGKTPKKAGIAYMMKEGCKKKRSQAIEWNTAKEAG